MFVTVLVKVSICEMNIVKLMLKKYNKCCTLAGLSERSVDLAFSLAD